MSKAKQSTDFKILSRIYGYGRGSVFTPTHFQDLGTRNAIDSALKRHTRSGTIRRLAQGLYDYPRSHASLGLLSPSIDTLARALAGRDATRLQPSGAYAANLLGLSDQVPMKVMFLTDGTPRSVRIGQQTITLKRTTPKNMATAGRISGLMIQALRYLGSRHVDESVISILSKHLTDADKAQLLKDIAYAPAWIADIIHRIARPPNS